MEMTKSTVESAPGFSPVEFGLVCDNGTARAAVQAGLALDPTWTIRRFRAAAANDNPTYLAGRERMYDGMRKAGAPEG
jgi:hypothetical protein